MEEKIKELEDALRALTLRIARLEGAPPKAAPAQEKPRPQSPPQPKKDSTIGMSKLLAVVSVICFVLAASFIVKLAIESGWLTAFRQWALLGGFGATLCVAGRYIPFVDRQYRSYLSGAGLVVLYIAAYASSAYFHIVDENMALIFSMVVSIVGLTMFNYHQSQIFPLVSVIGTYMGFLLMNNSSMSFWFLAAEFVIWALVFSWFSTHFRSRAINLLATYLGLGIYTFLNMDERNHEYLLFVLLTLGVQFFIFCWGVANFSVKNKITLSKSEAWSYFPAICFFYGVMYFFLSFLVPTLAPWIGLGMGLSFLAFFESIKKKLQTMDVEASKNMVHSFLALVVFQAGYLELLPGQAKPWLLPVLVVLNYVSEQKKDFPTMSRAFRILGMGIGALEFLQLIGRLLNDQNAATPLVAFVTLALGIFYYLQSGKMIQAKEKSYLGMVHVLAVLALFRIAHPYGSLAVSIAWALYAVLILGLGYMRRDRDLVTSSLVVLFFASIKALLYDGSDSPTSVRIGSLIFTGVLLFGTGVLFRQMNTWEKKTTDP